MPTMPLTAPAVIGDRVSYSDMANPLREGTVTEVKSSVWGTDYCVTWDDAEDGVCWSDLQQAGWSFLSVS